MIRQLREYFDTHIKEVYPDILEYTRDVFGNNDVDRARAQKYYNLVIGAADTERQDISWLDTFAVRLEIYATSVRDVQTEFDSLYDKAIQIRNNITCPPDIVAQNPIFGLIDIEPLGIIPTEEPTNDNTIKMEINFNAQVGTKF